MKMKTADFLILFLLVSSVVLAAANTDRLDNQKVVYSPAGGRGGPSPGEGHKKEVDEDKHEGPSSGGGGYSIHLPKTHMH